MQYWTPIDPVNLRAACRLRCSAPAAERRPFFRNIADTFGLEFPSLDRDVRWLPGWKNRDRLEQGVSHRRVGAAEPMGHGREETSSLDLRLSHLDLVLWVRVPWRFALFGLAKRVVRFYGSVRPAIAPSCPKRLPDRKLLSDIWNFEKKYAPFFTSAYRGPGQMSRWRSPVHTGRWPSC